MTRKLIALGVAVAAITVPAIASAHHGPMHRARYRQIDGPSFFPSRIIIRCPGWAEDVASTLRLVEYEGNRVIYRCVTNV